MGRCLHEASFGYHKPVRDLVSLGDSWLRTALDYSAPAKLRKPKG